MNLESKYPTVRQRSVAVVLDNHQLFADSFGKMIGDLSIFEDVRIFSEQGSLSAFLIKLDIQADCFFFLDYYLGEKTVLPIISDIRRICKNAKIVIVTVATDPVLLKNLSEHDKVDGLISKYSGTDDVVLCINRLQKNGKFISGYLRKIIEDTSAEKIPLTDRELEIVQMAAKGMTVDITAQKLNISRHTVAAHRRKILSKTGCATIASLLEMARNKNWI